MSIPTIEVDLAVIGFGKGGKTLAGALAKAGRQVARARIVGEPRGVMKAVVDAETDAVLGVTILAHDAHEIINTVGLAMRFGATASALRDGIYTHPSMSEALNDLFANLGPARAAAA